MLEYEFTSRDNRPKSVGALADDFVEAATGHLLNGKFWNLSSPGMHLDMSTWIDEPSSGNRVRSVNRGKLMPAKNSSTAELVGWFWSFEDDEKEKLQGTLQMDAGGRMKLKLINQESSQEQVRGAFDMPYGWLPRPRHLDRSAVRLAGLVSRTTGSGRSVRDEEITLVAA